MEASQEGEGEWTESKTAHIKNATATDNEGLKALRDEINAFACTISATNSPKKNGDKPKNGSQTKPKKDSNGKSKSKGPETGLNDPFGDGQNPIQCFKCGG